MARISGGDKLEEALNRIAANLKKATTLEAGFINKATYPDGTSVALVATTNEYGGTIKIPEHEQSIYRKVDKNGDFLRDGKFVKKSQSNFETVHIVPAHTVTIPPRPFFRNAIKKNSAKWPINLKAALKSNNYDARIALGLVGKEIEEEIQESIRSNTPPPNAESTAKAKGFSRTLIDTGVMLNSVTHLVK